MWDVIGHEWVIRIWQRGLAEGRLAHAYLLVGPPQIGKRTLALALAQALNCTGPEPPCGQCSSCQKIGRGVHPDVRVVIPERDVLRIDQIRSLQREASLAPYEGRYRVYILRTVEKATPEAANCLLKTLEEPPPRVVLVLTAVTQAALLPTLISRCQIMLLRPLSLKETEEALVNRWQVPLERAALLARLSGGRLGWAVTATKDDSPLKRRAMRLAELHELLQQKRVPRLGYVERLTKTCSQEMLLETLDWWAGWWRDVLLIRAGCPAQIANVDYRSVLEEHARRYELTTAHKAVADTLMVADWLTRNVNARLALEVLMLRFPRPVS